MRRVFSRFFLKKQFIFFFVEILVLFGKVSVIMQVYNLIAKINVCTIRQIE